MPRKSSKAQPQKTREKPKIRIEILVAVIGALATILAAVLPQVFPKGAAPPSDETDTPASTPTYSSVIYNPHPDPSDELDGIGVPMRHVPAGEFTMGCNDGPDDSKPAYRVYLDAFFIDKYEVTNRLYKTCVDLNVCIAPRKFDSEKRESYYGNPDFDDYPVVYVDWNMARIFCEWRDARLPTEAEWEKAARGTDERKYPWGDVFYGSLLNFCDTNCVWDWGNKEYDDGYKDTAPVYAYPNGISSYGVFNMSGNVIEWVADWYQEDYYATLDEPVRNPTGPLGMENEKPRVARGGSWWENEYVARTYVRQNYPPTDSPTDIGFRCVRDADP